MARGTGIDKVRIGRAQVRRASERPPEAPTFRRMSNKDTLNLAKAGAQNMLEGTREMNRLKRNQHTDTGN